VSPGVGRGLFLEVGTTSIPDPLGPLLSQEKVTSLPSDVAQDLRGVEAQLRKHKGLEHELMGTEKWVSTLASLPPTWSSKFPSLPCFQLGPL
jgi:hypothetical protein